MKVNIHDGKRTTRMGYTAVLIALAMIFSYIEAVFPFSWVTFAVDRKSVVRERV